MKAFDTDVVTEIRLGKSDGVQRAGIAQQLR